MSRIRKPFVICSAIGTVYGLSIIIKDRLGGLPYQGKEELTDKVFVITGCNSGIGKEVASALAKRKAKVIMACRDMEKCEEARKEIVLDTLNKYVYCRKCDLASIESIKQFAELFKKEHSRLDVLINNAGVMRCPKSYTQDGIEMQLGVNYMGHFLLTNLLLDVLKVSVPSKIVNISSMSHLKGKINKEDLNSTNNYDGAAAYDQSNLALCVFTKQLAKQLHGTNVTVNAIHPGIASTEITRHMSYHRSYLSTFFLRPFIFPFTKSPKQAASYVLNLALNPEFDKITGKYFVLDKEREMSEITKDEKLAKWLWLTSEKWTKLNM